MILAGFRSIVVAALAAALMMPGLARAGIPLIQSLEPASAFPGQAVHVIGFGFGETPGTVAFNGIHHPEAVTYWSDDLVVFTLPYMPGFESADVTVVRDLVVPSNPWPLGFLYPSTVFIPTPPPGRTLSAVPVTFRAVPEFDHGQVGSVTFEYRLLPDLSWHPFGLDTDGSRKVYGTTTWVGGGDGWSSTLSDPFPEGVLEVRATAVDSFGQVMTGIATYPFDPTPLAPRLLDGNPPLAASAFDGDALEADLEFTDAQIESLLMVLFPIRWHHRRTLEHADQDTMDIRDKNGNDVSDQACGPVAAAVCLKWFSDQYPALAQEIEELAKKIAKDAGTGPRGTFDDQLVAAIKAALKRAGLDPDQWKVTRQNDPGKVWRSMVEGLNRDGFDKILCMEQRSTVDVNGDGMVDSTDVVGHFVTMSSRGTRYRDYSGDGPPPYHIMGFEEYVDFMNPATGETEEYRVDTAKKPPEVVGFKVNDDTTGDPKIMSTICVKPPPSGNQASLPEQLPGSVVAAFPVPGPGVHHFAVPGATLPPGPGLVTFVGKDVNGIEASDFAWTMVVADFCDVGFTAANTAGPAPLSVVFANTSAPTDSVLSWEWDFETDGIVDSVDPAPAHSYAAPGDYTVTLRALNAHGVDEKVAPAMIHVTGSASVEGPVAITTLREVRPNPVRARAVVSFSLARASRVRLDVLSVDGRRVRTLSHGLIAAGEHAEEWNGADDRGRALPAGIYFVRLEAGGAAHWRRVALVP